MTRKNTTSPAELRSAADHAVAKWHESDAKAKADRTAYNTWCKANPLSAAPFLARDSERLFEHTTRSIPVLLAEEAAEQDAYAAMLALDAAELAEGDELALACDPKHLHDDLVALDTEQKALEDKLSEVRRRRDDRVATAHRAETQRAARRVASALPVSTPLPRHFVLGGKSLVAMLAERVEQGVPVPNRAAQLAAARSEERRIATNLEEQRLEKEEREKEKADTKKAKHEEEERAQRKAHQRERERREAAEADARRKDQLASDYLARRAAGASQ